MAPGGGSIGDGVFGGGPVSTCIPLLGAILSDFFPLVLASASVPVSVVVALVPVPALRLLRVCARWWRRGRVSGGAVGCRGGGYTRIVGWCCGMCIGGSIASMLFSLLNQ